MRTFCICRGSKWDCGTKHAVNTLVGTANTSKRAKAQWRYETKGRRHAAAALWLRCAVGKACRYRRQDQGSWEQRRFDAALKSQVGCVCCLLCMRRGGTTCETGKGRGGGGRLSAAVRPRETPPWGKVQSEKCQLLAKSVQRRYTDSYVCVSVWIRKCCRLCTWGAMCLANVRCRQHSPGGWQRCRSKLPRRGKDKGSRYCRCWPLLRLPD